MTSRVNICRPGYGASCSLCCGSHNYRASRGEIESLYDRRTALLHKYSRGFLLGKMAACRSDMTGSYYVDHSDEPFINTLPELFGDCPQCPFVGFAGKARVTGCLLNHEEGPSLLRHECFLSCRGKIFSCLAREKLDDDEILYAARLTGDWYFYSILVHDEELLRGLMREYPDMERFPPARRARLESEMEERISVCRDLHAIHSYFY